MSLGIKLMRTAKLHHLQKPEEIIRLFEGN